ncbi:ABC transporter ATP-binding protein [Paragemmobacter aquarius]|uniref:ABC transporter ATP-binding protein n=1 Tax=Paragemmobacter aquarius TaxID=2169400 RepID=UPI001E37954E|nr:ATP-binding cassette domain-containing protein [Gemmobacter aquarius]
MAAGRSQGQDSGEGAAAVVARDVTMDFGTGKPAVDAVSFRLEQGRFLTILGPSGSGKTTLLRMIAGFDRPTRGQIMVGGKPVDAAPPHRRSVGMVFQKLALFPHMTAAENVAFPLKMRRFNPAGIAGRVRQFLDLVKLDGYGDRRVNALSGGQQQRVAIARALVFEPELLLLDEPLAALDRKLREEMQLEFRRIQHELGVTTINVTHDQREALVVSDEIIVMDGGRIQQQARPVALYREPANTFVAGFLGVSTFLQGVAAEGA